MPSAVSPLALYGVVLPSTNTVVEAEYNSMRPSGVSFHASRIFIEQSGLQDDRAFEAFLEDLRSKLDQAIVSAMSCEPDHLIMGMSVETFWGGVDGNRRFEKHVRDTTGLGVTTGASACRSALERLSVERIAVLTPYQPVADEQVRKYFADAGFCVTEVVGLRCGSATSIARVNTEEITSAILGMNWQSVEAIVQVGTNLAAVAVAAALEGRLGKPVVAVNAATVWHALRSLGIQDRISGVGRLLAEF